MAKKKYRRNGNRNSSGQGFGDHIRNNRSGSAVLVRQDAPGAANNNSGGRALTTITADELIQSRANSDGRIKKQQGQQLSESLPSAVQNGVTIEEVQAVVNTAIAQNNQQTQNDLGQIKALLQGLTNGNVNNEDPQDNLTLDPEPVVTTTETNNSQPVVNVAASDVTNDSDPDPKPIIQVVNETEANQAIEKIKKEAEARVTAAKEQASKVITAAEARMEQMEIAMTHLQNSFGLYGMAAPSLNLTTNPLQETTGRVQQLVDMLHNVPSYRLENSKTNTIANQRDLTEFQNQLARWYKQDVIEHGHDGNIDFMQLRVYQDLEKSMRNSGLLSGTVKNAAGPTIGTPGSIGAFYLDILANFMRLTHNQSNIFWQFPVQVYDATTKPSLTMGIPRFNNLPEVTDPDDFLLATPGTFTATPAVYGTTADSQSLESNIVSVGIAEYGLGKNVSVGTRPVYLSEFHASTSLLPLLGAVDSRLMQSYFSFEELLIRLEYEACTIIGYNNRSDITFSPGDVNTGGDGRMTTGFVDSVYTRMYEEKIPAFNDGHYIFVMAARAANQFKASLGDIFRAVTPEQRMTISNILKAATGVEIGRVNNYFGCYNGFHIFIGNSFGVGLPGATPTVNTTSFGAGAVTTVESFAFGPGAVGRGISLAAEIRGSGVNPYQRGESWIWLSRENTAPMDLDINLDPGQQTRCFKVRTSIQAI